MYKGLWCGCPVAVKKWFDPDHTDDTIAEFRAEVMSLAELRHPNIVQFLGACMKPPNLCMVMEYLPHSLHSILYQSTVDMDQKRYRVMHCLLIFRGTSNPFISLQNASTLTRYTFSAAFPITTR